MCQTRGSATRNPLWDKGNSASRPVSREEARNSSPDVETVDLAAGTRQLAAAGSSVLARAGKDTRAGPGRVAKRLPVRDGTISVLATPSIAPTANVYEGNGQLSVAMPLPGAHPEHVEVVVGPTAVLVHAQCKYPQEAQRYHRHDWKVGWVHAEVPLPRRVDPARSRASLNFGVLVVMAPVSEDGSGEHRPAVQ